MGKNRDSNVRFSFHFWISASICLDFLEIYNFLQLRKCKGEGLKCLLTHHSDRSRSVSIRLAASEHCIVMKRTCTSFDIIFEPKRHTAIMLFNPTGFTCLLVIMAGPRLLSSLVLLCAAQKVKSQLTK